MDALEIALHPYRHSESLTPAELLAVNYLSHGMTAPMTAEITGWSVSDVKEQLRGAQRKLATKSGAHTVAVALRLGLIP